jgi:hypothetical protein
MKPTRAIIGACLLMGLGPASLAHSAGWGPTEEVGQAPGGGLQLIAADVGNDGVPRVAWAGKEPAGTGIAGAWIAENASGVWRRQLVQPTAQVPFVALRDNTLAMTLSLEPQPFNGRNESSLQLSTRTGSSWSAPRVIAPKRTAGFEPPKIGLGHGRTFLMGKHGVIEADAPASFSGVRNWDFLPGYQLGWSIHAEATAPTLVWASLRSPVAATLLRSDGQWAPPKPVGPGPLTTGAGPVTAWDGHQTLATWRRRRGAPGTSGKNVLKGPGEVGDFFSRQTGLG